MSPHGSAPCPFCDPPTDRICFRSEFAFGLWDGFPVSPGHALLIPRRHVATLFDASREERVTLFDALEAVRAIIDERYRPDGYNIGINHGAAGLSSAPTRCDRSPSSSRAPTRSSA